jgi:hypothetical protein
MPKKPASYSEWSRADLEAEEVRLAAERTRIRLEQNEVGAALEVHRALDALSPAARRIVRIGLAGATAPNGNGGPS